MDIRRLFPLLLLVGMALQSCQSDFDSRYARSQTTFYLADTSEFKGELIGLIKDSIVVDPADSLVNHATVHYSDLYAIRFHNDADAGTNAVFGMLIGGLGGITGGFLIGSLLDGYASPLPPQTPREALSYHPNFGFEFTLPIIGLPVGMISGLITGIAVSSDEVVYIEDESSLYRLDDFVLYRTEEYVRKYRGY